MKDYVLLRKFTIADAPRVAALVDDHEVSKWTSNIPHPYTEQDAIDWISRVDMDPSRSPYAVIVEKEIVACVSHWINGEGETEVGYWVGRKYWGDGICTRALTIMLMQDSFPETDQVVAKAMAGNIGSRRVLEKSGFDFLRSCTITKQGAKIEARFYVRHFAT